MPGVMGMLCPSHNPGRYEIGPSGPDLVGGMVCEVWLAGRWVRAVVEHSKGRSDLLGMVVREHSSSVVGDAYYLVLFDGDQESVCGVCLGMFVRMVE